MDIRIINKQLQESGKGPNAVWDNPVLLDKLETERDKKRRHDAFLTFDCFKARVKEDRVYCCEGKLLSLTAKDGTMALTTVMRGSTSSQCRGCESADYKSW